MSHESYAVNKLKDETKQKNNNTNRNHDNAEARSLTVLLPHSLWTTLVNLAPTTGVIAGGLGASLPARPAAGSILHRDNYKGKPTDALTDWRSQSSLKLCGSGAGLHGVLDAFSLGSCSFDVNSLELEIPQDHNWFRCTYPTLVWIRLSNDSQDH